MKRRDFLKYFGATVATASASTVLANIPEADPKIQQLQAPEIQTRRVKPTAIIAGNYGEFQNFLSPLRPEDRVKFIYVYNVERVIGFELSDVLCIGTYYKRSDIHPLLEIVKSRIR